MQIESVAALAGRLAEGDRRALARAITLAESTREADRRACAALLASLAPSAAPARRIGLTGTPGVGKSSFIETLGMHLVRQGHRVAVLAVDPSSARSGGSILGDKTRMPKLARHPAAFIRPSPSGAGLGGVARRTREAILLVEAAGFDVVLVETVGVGQSEVTVAALTDVFLLLLAPAGGDELQGVKRGIMEMADVVVINKADGALKPLAEAARADYAAALRLIRPKQGDPPGYPQALTASALSGEGVGEVWDRVAALHDARAASGRLAANRAEQAIAAMLRALEAGAIARVLADPRVAAARDRLDAEVAAGRWTPEAAAEALLALSAGDAAEIAAGASSVGAAGQGAPAPVARDRTGAASAIDVGADRPPDPPGAGVAAPGD